MKKINLKNIFNSTIFFISVFILSISNSFAQMDNGLQGSLNFKAAANNITNNILTSAITLLMTAAFVLFFYGIVRFIYDRSNGDDARLQKDKEAMLWGLIALFVMVSTWGIIKLAQSYIGIENDNNIQIQAVSFTPSPAITTTSGGTTPPNNTNQNPFNQPNNKPQGANCVGQAGATTQCATGLYCRDLNGHPVAEGASGTCKQSVSQDISQFPTISAPSNNQYVPAMFTYLKYANCLPTNIIISTSTPYTVSDTQYVKLFQKANGLTQNGIVDTKTWTALFNVVSGSAKKCQ